jgi:cellulose synthase/poly-beta-1,6-N-acetylglucosamine synthase-like glycosyltransferase
MSKLVVCIPARNEAEHLPVLLDAMATQTEQGVPIIVALNNTSDRSWDVLDAAQRRHPALKLYVDMISFPEADAHAGSARRRAMDLAADRAGKDGLIVTTDADARPPPEWLAANRAAMQDGLDVVGGRIVIDEEASLPPSLASMVALANRYWAQVRAIEDAIDPVPWDPLPRHGDHTGASLCITTRAYQRCGGVPVIASGEDRGLVRNVVRNDGRLAHPIEIWTRVSARTVGRAIGGMAEHMQRLQASCEAGQQIVLPSFEQWRARALWRREIRNGGGTALVAEREEELPPMVDNMVLDHDALESVA